MGLFTPAWQKTDEAKALSAIEKITDEQQLAKAVKSAPLVSVKSAACARISNPDLLLAVLKDTGEVSLWREFVSLLDETRQRDFYQFCTHANSIASLQDPRDQGLLYGFAMHQIMTNVALIAFAHLQDDHLKAEILLTRKIPLLKEEEIPLYIKDPKELIPFAIKNVNPWQSSPVLEAITKEEDLAVVIKHAKSSATRDAAVSRIHDPVIIEELVLSTEVNSMAKAELSRKVNDQNLIARALRQNPQNDHLVRLLTNKEVIVALLKEKVIAVNHLNYLQIDLQEILNRRELSDYHKEALRLSGGFICSQCGYWQKPKVSEPCTCDKCKALNHNYEYHSTVEQRGRHESGEQWKECSRCHDIIEKELVYRDTDY